VLSNTGEYLRALKDFDKALSMQPDNGDFYYSRAVVHDRLGNTDSAFADLAKAVGLISSEFGRSVAFARRAEILHKQGKLDESIKDYSQAIRLAPNFAYHFGNRGDVYSEKKEYEKAIADYSEAIKLDPKNAYFRHDRAEAYRALGQVDLAVKDEAAVETAPGSPSPESDEAMKSERAPISGGDLTRQAISLPKPAYPPIARAARASGLVVVRVTVDESGRVVTATAVEGHPLLQAASVAAARQAKFEPRKLDGQPVKVSGMITFRFEAQ
jgi:TonB family protein